MKALTTLVLGILCGVALTATAALAAEIGLRGVELRAGLVDIEDDAGTTIGFSTTADLGTLAPNFGLEAGIDFWTKNWDRGAYYDHGWTNIGFLTAVRYDLSSGGDFVPFAFGGLGFHLWKWSTDYSGPEEDWWDEVDDGGTELEIGMHLGAGAEYATSDRMSLVGRAGYNANGGADYLFIQGGVKLAVGE